MIGPIAPFNSIGPLEKREARAAMAMPLSGYLAGKERGGYYVRALEEAFASTFHVTNAIACNSATSGLLAAAFAIGLGPGDEFICPAMTMSATAAAPMFTGAKPVFMDIESSTFSLGLLRGHRKAIFVTNLFGHPACLHSLRAYCDEHGGYLIEDNAQSPFSTENGRYAGTIGHIGVFSFNVPNALQCGEGGMIVTNDDVLAGRLRDFINHGEVGGGAIGLNLRMPEVSAAIMIAQLERANEIMQSRIEQAEEIIEAIGKIPGIRPPKVRDGCSHAYYTIPFLAKGRRALCYGLKALGVPIVEGYVEPLYRLPAFRGFASRQCAVAEAMHDELLFSIENCRYSFTPDQIRLIGEAFKRTAEKVFG